MWNLIWRGHLVLFRERNGWCPYSERVWLAMEAPNRLELLRGHRNWSWLLAKNDDIYYHKQCCTHLIWERTVLITKGYSTLATVGDVAGEAKGLEYTTVLVDNYGSRARWIGGQTPQVQWPSGKRHGESLDIVKALEPWMPWMVGLKRQKQEGRQR